MTNAAAAPADDSHRLLSLAGRHAVRLASWTRISIAFTATVLGLLAWLLARLSPTAAAVVVGASVVLAGANVAHLRALVRRGRGLRVAGPLLSALDVLYVGALAWFAFPAGQTAAAVVFLGGCISAIVLAGLQSRELPVLVAGGLGIGVCGLYGMVRVALLGTSLPVALQESLLPALFVALATVLTRVGAAALRGAAAVAVDHEAAVAQREEMVRRLFQYQKMESIGTLAGGMAHDFNNILQRLTSLCEEAGQQSHDEASTRTARLMSEGIAEARFLVSELLALGTREALLFDVVDLSDLAAEVQAAMQPHLAAGTALTVERGDGPLRVHGDRRHLRRVVENLVRNACDAMPGGGRVTLGCSSQPTADGGRMLLLRVRDTGGGVPPDMVDRIFDPFVTTKKPGKGTGLGLALAQHIMNLHKGAIALETTGPGGTTFRLEFPQTEALEIDHDTHWMESRRVPAGVLLLDDDARILEVLRVFLRDLRYETWEARDLSQALPLMAANRERCRVVVMDWRLGSDEPQEVVRRLREVRQDVVIIVVSGYAPDTHSMERLGISKWLTKPYDRNMLDIEIQRALYGVR